MGKPPKGFGKPVQPKKKKSIKPPQAKPLNLSPLPEHESQGKKEARICQVFCRYTIPEVSTSSLKQYQDRLRDELSPGITLEIGEALGWEIPYVYGRFDRQAHQQQRQQQPSYLDSFQLVSLADAISPETGLSIVIRRTSDQQQFTLPLYHFRAPLSHPVAERSPYTALADYCLWWENYRPFTMTH